MAFVREPNMKGTLMIVVVLSAAMLIGGDAPATDPFVGNWKFNPEKSKMTGDTMRIDVLASGEYKVSSGEISETMKPDGVDRPVHFGHTAALRKIDDHTWEFTWKQKGRVLSTETWQLAPDQKTAMIRVTGTRPDGKQFEDKVTRLRVGGKSGLAGTWRSSEVKVSIAEMFEIRPFEGDGHAVIVPGEKLEFSYKFDGKEYPVHGPNVPEGATISGTRSGPRNIDTTGKVGGKMMFTEHMTV